MKRTLSLIVVGLALTLTGCATASAPAELTAVHYRGGITQAKEFVNCLPPSGRSGFDPGDGYFAYPARQVSYDATGGDAAESSRFKVVSSDNAELYVPVTVTFRLITDCETLVKFHENVGTRFKAWWDANGDDETTPPGWIEMLNYVIGKPLDALLDRVAQEYPYRQVWNDPDVKAEMEQTINDGLDDLVAEQAGGVFFEGFEVLILKPDPVDAALKSAIATEQAAVAEANAAEKKAEADIRTAEAEERLARAQARAQREEIAGFGGIENYLLAQCIASPTCGNPFRDQFLYGGQPGQ